MQELMVTAPFEQQCDALRVGAGACLRADRALQITGEDRVSWLSGMVTQDVKGLTRGVARYAVAVHEKGKILADLWVVADEQALWLWAPPETIDALLEHFERHIIMEDVELHRAPAARVLSLAGPKANALYEGALGARVFASERLAGPGLDVVLDEAQEIPAWVTQALARGALVAVSEEAWETRRIEAGVPRFGVDFDTQHYVQEAALTPRAVSFKKGCYVGQEVVCRLEMRGHVRRQLVSLEFEEPGDAPAKGTSIGDIGVITSSARSTTHGGAVAIAMLKWDAASAGGVVEVAGRRARIVQRAAP